MQNADIAALWDASEFNAGFLVVRPSPPSLQLYQIIRRMSNRRQLSDQRALNRAISMMKKGQQRGSVLRVGVLDRRRFLSGVDYFEKSGRKLPKLSDGCEASSKSGCPLVVHNNWIVGREAKIYRFREHLMWQYDGDEQYYSSETRKYLAYTNPANAAREDATERELSALQTALVVGHLLDRVVILPRFHCAVKRHQCPLNSIVHIKTFDSIFSGRYRESSFLQHPKVPASVKYEVTDRPMITHDGQTSDVMLTSSDIRRLFGDLSARVLNLTDLQRVKIDLADREFGRRLQAAFRRARYRQIH